MRLSRKTYFKLGMTLCMISVCAISCSKKKTDGTEGTPGSVIQQGHQQGSATKIDPRIDPKTGKAYPVTVATAESPKPDEPTCFTFTYQHKKLASHSDDESCSRHKNLIQFKHAKVNMKSVCVRVNNKPVRFQQVKGKHNQVIIGAIAGPEATITTRYCINNNKCSEDCTVPRDEFMDAIGASEGNTEMGMWDPKGTSENEKAAHAKLNQELKKELSELEAEDSQGADAVFKDWIVATEADGCAKREVASK